jgi:hypothetical protein
MAATYCSRRRPAKLSSCWCTTGCCPADYAVFCPSTVLTSWWLYRRRDQNSTTRLEKAVQAACKTHAGRLFLPFTAAPGRCRCSVIRSKWPMRLGLPLRRPSQSLLHTMLSIIRYAPPHGLTRAAANKHRLIVMHTLHCCAQWARGWCRPCDSAASTASAVRRTSLAGACAAHGQQRCTQSPAMPSTGTMTAPPFAVQSICAA